ncbi:MAG: amino acid permease, partial [Bacteroidota bacterium]|nr:amino acid permease [Bacteroidota bacterium]
VVIAIVALLLGAVLFSAGSVKPQNFSPFFPNGFFPVGTAAALIFWSYLGYENVSNVAEEFRDPQRDFRRSIILSVVLIGVLYIAVAIVSIGTLAYEAGGSVAPFAAIFSNLLGSYGAAGTAVLALFIIFGTANAYTAGMSRVIFAAARDGGFPKVLEHINPATGVPHRSLVALSGCALCMLFVYYFFDVDLATALLIPSGAAILIYIIGSAAGIKLLRAQKGGKIFPWISLLMSLAILPFVGPVALAAIFTVAAGLIYGWLSRRTTTKVAEGL